MPKRLLLLSLLFSLLLSACTSVQRFPVLAQSQTASFPPPAPLNFDPATKIVLTPILEDLDRPVFVTHAGDGSGRIFIIEKGGQIRIFSDDALRKTPFLDISERVTTSGNEQGLLGLAFPPNFAERGFFFVNYTNKSGDTVIARYKVTADPNIADASSETIILEIDQPAKNHNGGMLAFTQDGMLWIGMGDGGGSGDRYNNGQNPETLLGKMLRIDVTSDPTKPYTIPGDNPWASSADSVRDEIWAAGLRNPWRFSFDRANGDLWIGDVGQNQIEEINRIPTGNKGLNFGWPIIEGSDCYTTSNCDPQGLVLPVVEYKHGSDGCSTTGGYVYRGSKIPALAGVYLYGDYCSGRIWALWFNAEGKWQSQELLDSDQSISSFGEDESGEVYVVGYGGSVFRIESEKDDKMTK